VFVLWSLIALPTLTVLIGAIGDSISESVDGLTVKLAKHLPDNMGAISDLKNQASKKKGAEFNAAKPPGFMTSAPAASQDFASKEEADAVKGMSLDLEGSAGSVVENGTGKEEAREAGRHYRPYLLMKEMKNVLNHLNASPPRKYDYAEWTWFLKLMGEDEADEGLHRSLGETKESHHNGRPSIGTPVDAMARNVDLQPWSWLGNRSPLMADVGEPRWVLEKLMSTLEAELKIRGDDAMKEY
jgi:potassium channel subfamily K